MSNDNPTAVDAVDSTAPQTGTVEVNVSNLDSVASEIAERYARKFAPNEFEEAAAKAPGPDADEEGEPIEVSTDEDEAPVDGDSDTDAGVEEEATEVAESGTAEDTLVTWEEMQDFSFEIGGKSYDAKAIKAALGRNSKQEEARAEVEARQKALDEATAKFESQVNVSRQTKEVQEAETNLAAYANQINAVQQQLDEAEAKGDDPSASKLDRRLRKMISQFNQARGNLDAYKQQTYAANIQLQEDRLREKGFEALITDKQRNQELASYVKDNYSPQTFAMMDENADWMIVAEKARLYDKAQSSAKGKLKGAKKTLKGGANKPKSKPVAKDPLTQQTHDIVERYSQKYKR